MGRLLLVVGASLAAALVSLVVSPRPDPRSLVPFFEKVRPLGAWGPVRALCPEVVVDHRWSPVVAGVVGGLCTIYGLIFGLGNTLLGNAPAAGAAAAVTIFGGLSVAWALRQSR